MTYRIRSLALFTFCLSFNPFNLSPINSVQAAEEKVVSSKIEGKVTEVIDVAAYTYIEVETGTEKVWAAAPKVAIKKGEKVTISTNMPMKNFFSDTIDRTFPLIYFVNGFSADANNNKTAHRANIKPIKQVIKGIEKVKGGNTIAEIHAKKASLKGKTVKVRGKVTRFASEVMDKNWLHIQDSSGSNDLTITTDKTNIVAVGDIVVVEGKLELDKDFGYGYLYPVMLQEGKVTKENK